MGETTVPPTPAAPGPAASGPGIGQRLGSLGGRTLLTLLVLLALTAAADRSGVLADWSADRRFTLSPRLTSLLLAQQEPVELVGIWSGDDDDRLAPITALVTRMGSVTPKVTFRHLDPELQKPLVTAFRERFKEAQPGTLYVTRGTRAFTIGLTPATRLVLQREVGGALVTLAEAQLTPAYLLQGHGELRPEAGPPGEGANLLARSLTLLGFEVSRLDASTPQPPAPDGVLVIAGPTGPLGERDLKLLTRHLQDGGGALILADDRAPDDLVRWLRQHGASLGAPAAQGDPGAADGNPGLITVSLRQHLIGQEAEFPHHNLLLDRMLLNPGQSITQPLLDAGIPLLSPWTSPVFALMPDRSADGQALAQRYRALGTQPFLAEPLLRSVPGDSWAKPRAQPLATPPGLAQQPSLPLAYAIEYQPSADSVRAQVGGRLVIWGSRQAACDGVLAQTNFANEQFLRHASTWLARRTAATDIPEAELAAFQINASDNGMFAILALLVAVVPCLCLGIAMLTWWDRR